jgi:hypothetical protein
MSLGKFKSRVFGERLPQNILSLPLTTTKKVKLKYMKLHFCLWFRTGRDLVSHMNERTEC